MKVQTKYFGCTEYTDAAIIKFPRGLPGFENLTEFLCLEQPSLRPLAYLQSVTEREICFLTLPVRAIDPSYDLDLHDDEAATLKLASPRPAIGDDIACIAILCTGPDRIATANLAAPVVINIAERIGLQAIQTNSQYDCAYPLACAEAVEAAC